MDKNSPTQSLDLDVLKKAAEKAALAAGELIASYSDRKVDVLPKEGGDNYASSVVTEVDFKSQEIILDALAESRKQYSLGLLTEEEEDDGSRFADQAFWCIDPIDGTLPFTESVPGYAVSIGLVSRKGESLLGVIYDPREGDLYSAVKGGGAFKNGVPWKSQKGDGPLTWVIDRDQPSLPDYRGLKKMLKEAARDQERNLKIINNGGAVLNACWALEGAPGLYFKIPKSRKGGGCFWDFAASACIICEAGGVAFDFMGHPLHLNEENPYMNGPGIFFLSGPDVIPLARRTAEHCGFSWD